MKLVDGMKVMCEIKGDMIKNAKLYKEDGDWYICQDVVSGRGCSDKLGYQYSWSIGAGDKFALKDNKVTNLRPVSEDIENVWQGCVIVNKEEGERRKVLGICGEIIFVSFVDGYDNYCTTFTAHELKKLGYKIDLKASGIEVEPEEDKIEIEGKSFTVDELKKLIAEAEKK